MDYKVPLFQVNVSSDAYLGVKEVLSSGYIGEGKVVREFESKLSERFNNLPTVAVNSCTSALIVALRACGVGPGYHVITTPNTFPATTCAINTVGAEPLWCTVDLQTGCNHIQSMIDLIELPAPAIGAAIVVLVGGLVPVGFQKLREVCSRRNIPLILDAAEAYGTTYKGKPICCFADYTAYSFQSIKHLTTGDGGCLVIKNPDKEQHVRELIFFGLTRGKPQTEDNISDWGYKFHMNNINAAIGLANLEIADKAITASRKNAEYYNDRFSSKEAINNRVTPITIEPESNPSYWVYGVKVIDRLRVKEELEEQGFQSSIGLWYSNELHTANRYTWPGENSSLELINRPRAHFIYIPNGYWVNEIHRKIIANIVINSN